MDGKFKFIFGSGTSKEHYFWLGNFQGALFLARELPRSIIGWAMTDYQWTGYQLEPFFSLK